MNVGIHLFQNVCHFGVPPQNDLGDSWTWKRGTSQPVPHAVSPLSLTVDH